MSTQSTQRVPSSPSSPAPSTGTTVFSWRSRVLRWLPLGLLLAGTALLYLYGLGSGPDPLDVDEGYNGVDALRVLQGHFAIYFAANNGAEPLYVYLTALSTAFLGPSMLALRLPAALLGIARVAANYLLCRIIFAEEGKKVAKPVALLTGLTTALSLWSLHLSRNAIRVGLFPLLATLCVLLLWRGLRGRPARGASQYWGSFAGAGICAGLALYTYLPSRFLPIFLVLLLGHLWWSRRQWLWAGWRSLALFALLAVLTAAPLAGYYASHWSAFNFRVNQVAFTNPAVNGGQPIKLLLNNVRGTLEMFTGRGDDDAQYNVLARPVFPVLPGILFIVGVGIACWRWRNPAYGLILLWLGMFLLPGILSARSPHFARQAGILPTVYIFPALALWSLWRLLDQTRLYTRVVVEQRRRESMNPLFFDRLGDVSYSFWKRALLAAVLLLFIASTALPTMRDYFFRRLPPVTTPASLLQTLPTDTRLYVAGGEEAYSTTAYLTNLNPRVRATHGFNSLVLPHGDLHTVLYLVERDWYTKLTLEILSAWYTLTPVPLPAGMERFSAFHLEAKPVPSQLRPAPQATLAIGARLLDYYFPDQVQSGSTALFALHWQVKGPVRDDPGQDYSWFVHLVDHRGNVLSQQDWLGFPTPEWHDGDEVVSWYNLTVPAGTPPGLLNIELGMYSRATLQRVPLSSAGSFQGTPPLRDQVTFGRFLLHTSTPPPPAHQIHAIFGNEIELTGYTLLSGTPAPGSSLRIRLYWRAVRSPTQDYTAFVHLLDRGGRLQGQQDSQPLEGRYPTGAWSAGEVVDDTYTILLPATAVPGPYRLELGWYSQPSLRRLPVDAESRQGDAFFISL